MAIVRFHPVHLMNAEHSKTAADPHIKPTELGCNSVCKLRSSTSITIYPKELTFYDLTHDSQGVQPVPKALYYSGLHNRYKPSTAGNPWTVGPHALQSSMSLLDHCTALNNLKDQFT